MVEHPLDSKDQRLRRWMIDAFGLSEKAVITSNEHECRENGSNRIHSEIEVRMGGGQPLTYRIPKPLEELNYEDIKHLKESVKTHAIKKHPILGRIFWFFGWWFAFSGMYAMFAVCPFCGQVGCPAGGGSVGLVGGLFALLMQSWKGIVRTISNRLFRRN